MLYVAGKQHTDNYTYFSPSHRQDDYFVGNYRHYVFGSASITMEDGSLYFQYLALRGRLQRSKWRDKYYLLLDQHYSDVLGAPSTGFSVYFGRTTRRDNFVDQMAVTAIDKDFPPIFVRQNISAAYGVGLSSILFTSYIICVMVTLLELHDAFFSRCRPIL